MPKTLSQLLREPQKPAEDSGIALKMTVWMQPTIYCDLEQPQAIVTVWLFLQAPMGVYFRGNHLVRNFKWGCAEMSHMIGPFFNWEWPIPNTNTEQFWSNEEWQTFLKVISQTPYTLLLQFYLFLVAGQQARLNKQVEIWGTHRTDLL